MHIPDDPAYYESLFHTGRLGFPTHRYQCWPTGRAGLLGPWYPEAARLMAMRGADMLIYPTAIGYAANDDEAEQQRQREAWTTIQRAHAVANGLPVVAVNRVGFEPDPSQQTPGINWVSSFVAGPQGEFAFSVPTTPKSNAPSST